MCGIAGFIRSPNDTTAELRDISIELFSAMQSRGQDAAGYAASFGKREIRICKADVTAHALVRRSPLFNNWETPNVLMMHTRAETQGKAFYNGNNHPIMQTDSGLALIHNGWVFNDDELTQEYNLSRDAQVDSEVIVQLIAKWYGQQCNSHNAIHKAMKLLDGAFACAMMQSKRPDELWLWRRDNPIEMAFNKERTILVFASERAPLTRSLGHSKHWTYWSMVNGKSLSVKARGDRLRFRSYQLPDGPESTHWGWKHYYDHTGYDDVDYLPKDYRSYTTVHAQCVVCGDGFNATNADYLTCVDCSLAGYNLTRKWYGDLVFPVDFVPQKDTPTAACTRCHTAVRVGRKFCTTCLRNRRKEQDSYATGTSAAEKVKVNSAGTQTGGVFKY